MASRLRVVATPAAMTLRGTAAAFRRAATSALLQIGREAQSAIRQRIRRDTDRRGYRGRHDRGLLVNSITALPPVVTATRAEQSTVSQPPAADYALVHEDGRRAGKRPPPLAPLRAWIARTDKGRRLLALFMEQSGLKRKAALEALARTLARSIARKGIPGLHFMDRTAREFRAGRSARIVAAHFAREAAR